MDLWIDNAAFDRAASTTFKVVGGPATLSYRSGSVTGDVAEDVVTFGTFSVSPQRFLLGVATPPPVAPKNGNLGLPAPDATSAFGATPFWGAVRKNDPSVDSTMSFKFPPVSGNRQTREEEHNNQPGGVLTVGGRNASLFTGDPEFLPLVTFGGLRTYWALPVICSYPICARLVLGSFSPTRTNLRYHRRWGERSLAAGWCRFH